MRNHAQTQITARHALSVCVVCTKPARLLKSKVSHFKTKDLPAVGCSATCEWLMQVLTKQFVPTRSYDLTLENCNQNSNYFDFFDNCEYHDESSLNNVVKH